MEFIQDYKYPSTAMLKKAEDIQSLCRDYLVKDVEKNFYMDDYGNFNFMGEVMPASSWALSQAGIKVGVPSQYLEKCISHGFSELAAENFNTWIRNRDKKSNFLVRTYDNTVRGILSDRYTQYDSPDILTDVFSLIDDKQWKIKGSILNEERMHLRFVSEDKLGIANDDLFPAIFLDSSDVGRCAINIRFGIYRLACTNGLIIPTVAMNYHQKHIGIKPDIMIAAIREILTNIPKFINHSTELIEYADKKKVSLLTQHDVDAVIRQMCRNGISESDANGVIQVLREKYTPTQWGVANAITEFAQTKTLETRLDMEKAAGQILLAA